MVLGGNLNRRSSNFLETEKDDESAEANFVDARVDPVSKIPKSNTSICELKCQTLQ